MKIDEFKNFANRYANQPVIFFFPIDSVNDRNDLDSMTRNEMMEIASDAIPLYLFDEDWNDTDESIGRFAFIPDPLSTWCAVSDK